MAKTVALIIGAGPAGLTAAHELLARTDMQPVVYEMDSQVGGISKTVNHKGNRIDIGGHRFFSKSERIMEWWQRVLPVQGQPARDDIALGRQLPLAETGEGPDPEESDRVMLVRRRVSRIYFMRKFFDYPVSLGWSTLSNLGPSRVFGIGLSYLRAKINPAEPEKSLEDFFVNRFGRDLYRLFFKDYTEKVWGVPCDSIRPEWGAQRVKGLSLSGAVLHAVRGLLPGERSIAQTDTETSLIQWFLYPKFGPGQLWEEVARHIESRGAQVRLRHKVTSLIVDRGRLVAAEVMNLETGDVHQVRADWFVSSMPVKDLIGALGQAVPSDIRDLAESLPYRDFVTVGLLVRKLALSNESKIPAVGDLIPDNWIYVQERDVRLGRLQVFNNWSPYMVADPDTVWLGLEYFCSEGDDLWRKADGDMLRFAMAELERIGIIRAADVLDGVVIRVPKAYPAYFGSYERFNEIRHFVDGIPNLYLVGRNGMHRYNNMDHSMLSAIAAVEGIVSGRLTKDDVWSVNAEQEYHEQRG